MKKLLGVAAGVLMLSGVAYAHGDNDQAGVAPSGTESTNAMNPGNGAPKPATDSLPAQSLPSDSNVNSGAVTPTDPQTGTGMSGTSDDTAGAAAKPADGSDATGAATYGSDSTSTTTTTIKHKKHHHTGIANPSGAMKNGDANTPNNSDATTPSSTDTSKTPDTQGDNTNTAP